MKNRIFLFFLFLTGSFQYLSAYQSVNWEFVKSFPDVVINVCTQGEDTVYVVGQNGFIAQSPDRGKTWNYQYITNNTLNDIYFVSHNVGLIVGNNGTILKTTDAGSSWTVINSGTSQQLNAVSATSINNIWAVGDNGTAIKSNDVGLNWNVVPISSNSPYFTEIDFKNGKGYIIGTNGNVFQTSNDGNSWTLQTIEGYPFEYGYFRFLSLTEHKTFIYESYDDNLCVNNNNIWEKLKTSDLYSGSIAAIRFITDYDGFLITSTSTTGNSSSYLSVYQTSDGGNNWIYSDKIETELYRTVLSFANDTIGYLISRNNIYRTPFVGDIIMGISQLNQKVWTSQINHQLSINSPYKSISCIKILSFSGKVMSNKSVNSKNEIILSTEDLVKGVYVLQIYFNDKTQTSIKWIKQ